MTDTLQDESRLNIRDRDTDNPRLQCNRCGKWSRLNNSQGEQLNFPGYICSNDNNYIEIYPNVCSKCAVILGEDKDATRAYYVGKQDATPTPQLAAEHAEHTNTESNSTIASQLAVGDEDLREGIKKIVALACTKAIGEVVQPGKYPLAVEILEEAANSIENLLTQATKRAEVEGSKKTISAIYGIANDLANSDPGAVGSVSLAPYFANAVTIYQEFLKGDDYERIDWKALDLPTLRTLTTTEPTEAKEEGGQ